MLTPSDVRQVDRSSDLEQIAAVKTATTFAKWKDAVESVKQEPVFTLDAPADRTTQYDPRGLGIIEVKPRPTQVSIGDLNLISFEPLQEWEGTVVAVGEEDFTANLLDITAKRQYEEEIATFPIADVSADDRAFLRAGGVFRWLIGYERHPSGTKKRASSIVFRRLADWSNRDLALAKEEAAEILGAITWE